MNDVEERLRAALQAHAEDFRAGPDAWERLQARHHADRRIPRPAWPRLVRPVIPMAAAAAVVAIVVAAGLAVSRLPGRTGSAGAPRPAPGRTISPGSSPVPHPRYVVGGPDSQMLQTDPADSAVIGLRVPWIRTRGGLVTAYFWLGRNNPAFWPDQINPGLQFCHDVVNITTGEKSGFCWPLPELSPGHLVGVTGSEGVGTDQTIMVGAAAAPVASVTAVLADGRIFPGTVGTGRGFIDKAWTVGYPWTKGFPYTRGARLVFRDASGNVVASLSPHAPLGPRQAPRPRRGGVRVYSYPASHGEPAGQVDAYLIDGYVGFWSRIWGGTISQVPAAGTPTLGGLTEPFGPRPGGSWTTLRAFGYAHANVARVVLRGPDGRQTAASMIAVSWPGLRLWTAGLPMSARTISDPRTKVTATAYDGGGHLIGQVRLGSMP